MPRRELKVPHTLVLLFAMIVAAFVLTHVLPAGSFERVENEHKRPQVVPGTYRATPEVAAPSPLVIFTSVPRGMEAAAEIIFFVFIIGGAFAVLRHTGAIDAFVSATLSRLGHRPFLLVVGGIFVFAVGSSTIGMAEEYLPFVPVLVAMALALRYDPLVGVAIVLIGYGVGYGTATINPFTVLIAQDVAGLQPASALGFRAALGVVFLVVGVHHLWRYASAIHRDPSRRLVPVASDVPAIGASVPVALTATHALVLVFVVAMLAMLIWGLTARGWYLVEMGALFLAVTLGIAVIARIAPDTAAKSFGAGASELTMTALLIGFARAIQVVLDDGKVVDTIVHGLSVPLQSVGPSFAAVGMFLVQSVINLFIPSGSGQAYVTMPIMAPLADIVGISRQVAVLAFQFGDGFTNIVIPTNPITIGMLAIAGVPYPRWLRFVLPLMLKIWIVGSLALVVAVWMGVT